MSQSTKPVPLKLQGFLLLVLQRIQIKKDRTLMSGVLADDELSIPSPDGSKKLEFYLSNSEVSNVGNPGNLLYCSEASVYFSSDKYAVLIDKATLLGNITLGKDTTPTNNSVESLPFESKHMSDHTIPTWQIPPRN